MATITIAIPTVGRMDSLTSTITSVARSLSRLDSRHRASILVAGSGRPHLDFPTLINAASPVPIQFISVYRLGVATARNALLEYDDSQFLVFLDDDLIVVEQWISALLEVAEQSGADAVAGPVNSVHPDQSARWRLRKAAFSRRRFETGTAIPIPRTGNLLMRRSFLQRTGLRFNTDFDRLGGEDYEFGLRFLESGGTCLWCDQAWVVEAVSDDALALSAIIRRSFRSGRIQRRASEIVPSRPPAELSRGFANLFVGVLLGVPLLVARSPLSTRLAMRAARGAGLIVEASTGFWLQLRSSTPRTG